MRKPRREPRNPPWMPCDYTVADVVAVRAVVAGQATEEQQRRAVAWIVKVASAADEETHFSDNEGGARDSAYAAGRAFVGRSIRKMVDLPASVIDNMRKEND